MVFVQRDPSGKIIALYKEAKVEGMESLPLDNLEVVAFLTRCDDEQKFAMLQSDLQLIRVIEDVIEILMSKNLINITDFPPTVVEKLLSRKGIRSQLSDAFGLIDDYDVLDDTNL